jgi:DNA-binding winged helix-turn-helix (wHTH) protein
MVRFRFGQYIFHTHGLKLERSGRKVPIRPKTALLLSVLIENRDRTVKKQELFQLVWNTDYVQDHALFQLISEIRKLAPDNELIRTQPNVGYQWVARTEVCSSRRFHIALAAAASVACLYASFSLFNPPSNEINSISQNGLQSILPAMSAYSKGVVALDKGEIEKAEKWLRFSLAENPDSTDSQLLLAEVLLQQDKLIASESLAQSVMHTSKNSAYSTSAAADLLSRIYQKQGSVYNALEYALKGNKELDTTQAFCTAEAFDLRIQVLSELLNKQSEFSVFSSSTQNSQPAFSDYLISSAANNADASETEKPDQSDTLKQCNQLKKSLPDDELSDCFELQSALNSPLRFVTRGNTLRFSGHS